MRLYVPFALAVCVLALPGGGSASSCPSLRIAGTASADALNGTSKGERIDGLGGDDVIAGNGGDDCIFGGDGDDHLEGGFGRDLLDGGSGDDLIGGGQEPSVIRAGSGEDRVSSSNGVADSVDCGGGTDRVTADRSDRLIGCETVRYAGLATCGYSDRRNWRSGGWCGCCAWPGAGQAGDGPEPDRPGGRVSEPVGLEGPFAGLPA